MARIGDPQPLPGSRLGTASRAYQAVIDDLARRAHLAAGDTPPAPPSTLLTTVRIRST